MKGMGKHNWGNRDHKAQIHSTLNYHLQIVTNKPKFQAGGKPQCADSASYYGYDYKVRPQYMYILIHNTDAYMCTWQSIYPNFCLYIA